MMWEPLKHSLPVDNSGETFSRWSEIMYGAWAWRNLPLSFPISASQLLYLPEGLLSCDKTNQQSPFDDRFPKSLHTQFNPQSSPSFWFSDYHHHHHIRALQFPLQSILENFSASEPHVGHEEEPTDTCRNIFPTAPSHSSGQAMPAPNTRCPVHTSADSQGTSLTLTGKSFSDKVNLHQKSIN